MTGSPKTPDNTIADILSNTADLFEAVNNYEASKKEDPAVSTANQNKTTTATKNNPSSSSSNTSSSADSVVIDYDVIIGKDTITKTHKVAK